MAEASQHRARAHPTRARYYQIHLDRNFFRDWTLREVWGGIDSSPGPDAHRRRSLLRRGRRVDRRDRLAARPREAHRLSERRQSLLDLPETESRMPPQELANRQ